MPDMKKTEDDLCLLFAEHAKNSWEFLSWVLSQTKFRERLPHVRLLHEEQMNIRPRKFWWRHWWCHVPELKKDRETDIFMVFEDVESNYRFALHIENKTYGYRFSDGQAEGYSVRAQHMANKKEYLSYNDFETVLISPSAFREKYKPKCDLFDVYISHESIAEFIPEFLS